MNNQSVEHPLAQAPSRVKGIVLFVIALGILKFQGLDLVAAAYDHHVFTYYAATWVLFGPALILGTAYSLGGEPAESWLKRTLRGKHGTVDAQAIALAMLLFVPSVLLFLWVQSQVTALGYQL